MENSLFSGVPKFRPSTASLQCAWLLGHLKNINFPFETNGKLMILGVPILKHFRVSSILPHIWSAGNRMSNACKISIVKDESGFPSF